MTVDDMLRLCIEDEFIDIEIFSFSQARVVWRGKGRSDVPYEYSVREISSWDLPTKPYHITINID